MMKLALISQQCETFKVEFGVLGASWTSWTFETFFSEQQVLDRIARIDSGNLVKVWGFDILNNDWIKVLHQPILNRVK